MPAAARALARRGAGEGGSVRCCLGDDAASASAARRSSRHRVSALSDASRSSTARSSSSFFASIASRLAAASAVAAAHCVMTSAIAALGDDAFAPGELVLTSARSVSVWVVPYKRMSGWS